jgi:hypothetical protein
VPQLFFEFQCFAGTKCDTIQRLVGD